MNGVDRKVASSVIACVPFVRGRCVVGRARGALSGGDDGAASAERVGHGATGPPAVVVGTVKPVTTRTLLLEVSAM